MTTRPYNDCLADCLALCGVPDANAAEVARIGRFLNMAFRRAYAESDYWPRWLRCEERIVSEDGLLPYSQAGLEDIAVVRRIHATEPFAECGAAEYPNYYAKGDGVQIAGYAPREKLSGLSMRVSGELNPDVAQIYDILTTDPTTGTPTYIGRSNTNYSIIPTLDTDPIWSWVIGAGVILVPRWQSDGGNYPTPDLANGTYIAGGGATGDLTIESITEYSAWVTYKAAFSEDYGAGEEVPEEWADFAIYDAYGRFLSQDGNKEAGMAECQLAYSTYLVPQLERLDHQSGGHVFTRNINHGNTQAR